ncbi:MAG: phosphomannomutase/phosphoglucomutase [Holosporaceae bacterium]|jgi:phosphomannomutase|nr:phosphomannomutase/phosphoglucomutase [Holosporaceae bacterium]
MKLWEIIKDFFFMDEELCNNSRVIAKEIFREYDIRGIVDQNLFLQDAYYIGRAFGTFLAEKKLKKVCVGHDCRNSSSELFRELSSGLIKSGMEVISLGVCHTPMVYYAEHKMNFDACVMVTGSHNPPEYNGFKFMLGLDPFFGKDIKTLAEMIVARKFIDGNGREVVMNHIFSSYVKDIISDFQFSNDLKIAWDIGNGATSNAVKAVTSMIPGKHHLLFEEMDGNFPNRSPDPTTAKSIEYLAKFVSYNDFDAGFAFDSDGDRLCVVNNAGEMLYSDQLLSIIAKDFLQKNPGAQVIADVKSCNSLFETIKSCGGIAIMEKVGHSFIKARMKSSGALLAGELSGHIYFKDRWFGFDDGVYAALRCLELLSANKNAFSNLKYGFVTPEIRIECSENEKFLIIESLKKKLKNKKISLIEIDGIRVTSDLGWWILRASNTQSALSLRIEGYSEENMKKIKADIIKYLQEYIPHVSLDT